MNFTWGSWLLITAHPLLPPNPDSPGCASPVRAQDIQEHTEGIFLSAQERKGRSHTGAGLSEHRQHSQSGRVAAFPSAGPEIFVRLENPHVFTLTETTHCCSPLDFSQVPSIFIPGHSLLPPSSAPSPSVRVGEKHSSPPKFPYYSWRLLCPSHLEATARVGGGHSPA